MKYLKHINFGSPKFENENNENVIDDLYDIFVDLKEDYPITILPNTNGAQYIYINISSCMVSTNDTSNYRKN